MTADLERAANAVLRDLGIVVALNKDDPYHRLFTIQLSTADLLGCVEAALETLAESEAFVEAAARALSITGTHNPNPKKPGEQLPQVPWDQQPDGWRDRCRGEAHAALRSGIAAVLGRKP